MATYDPSALTYDPANPDDDTTGYDAQEEGSEGRGAEDEDDDDYDPSFGFAASEPHQAQPVEVMAPYPAESKEPVTGQPSVSKPRTMGGFIVEDDEDEEEDEGGVTQGQETNGTGVARGSSKTATPMSVDLSAQDVSLASAPTTDNAAVLTNSGQSLVGPATAAIIPLSLPEHDLSRPNSTSAVVREEGKMIPGNPTVTPPTATILATRSPAQIPETARLPYDKVGRLEDRIKDDPKAEASAWQELIAHYKEKDQSENVRKIFERFLEVFPTSATIWIDYIQFVLEHIDRNVIDNLLSRSLEQVQSLDLWNTYLEYLRRILPLTNDPTGQNRATITQAFEAVLDNVGIDPDAGNLWSEYIDFISAGPGTVGGTGWQDAQKMDLLRKAYQRAVKIPHSELTRLWKDYDKFEMNLNKANGRKSLQEQSPHYMTARSASMQLSQWTEGLDRKSLPVLPPIHGCEGEDAFGDQVDKWRGWIEWEKTDPLVFKEEDIATYYKRVIYAYQQAVMYLRFYPQIWYDAAQWCFEQTSDDIKAQGEKFLENGMLANPESVLLALKKADRIETTLDAGSTDAIAIANGERLDVPFESVLKALYALREKMVKREKQAVAQVQEHFANLAREENADMAGEEVEDGQDESNKPASPNEEQMQLQIQAISTASRGQLDVLKRTISYVWVAKMRTFRRIQGQGMPNKPKKGFRGVFAEARPRGQLSSDVYIASALMEWHCYKDPSALKIFERGLKLFPTDELFAQEYIKHLISINDMTNARVVFETTITKILAPAPANAASTVSTSPANEMQKKLRVRSLFGYMHSFESNYGDLAQIQKLEKRMADLYPEEPDLARFADRFASMPPVTFDAIDIQLIISPSQARPKPEMLAELVPPPPTALPIPSIEDTGDNLRLGPNGPYLASPKRPLEDSDTDSPQRKFLRGDSPLKGAAGRRMQSNAAAAAAAAALPLNAQLPGAGFAVKSYVPTGLSNSTTEIQTFDNGVQLLPKPIYELLRKLPGAKDYNSVIFDPVRTVEFLQQYDLQAARARVGR